MFLMARYYPTFIVSLFIFVSIFDMNISEEIREYNTET